MGTGSRYGRAMAGLSGAAELADPVRDAGVAGPTRRPPRNPAGRRARGSSADDRNARPGIDFPPAGRSGDAVT